MIMSTLIPLAVPGMILACAAVARVASDLQTQAVVRHATRVAQIEGTVVRIAGGIAHDLLAEKAAGSTDDVLNAIKGAAVAEGVAYVMTQLPATVAKTGVTQEGLIAMLNGETGRQTVAALGPSLLSAAGAALLLPVAPAEPSLAAVS